MPAPPGSPKVTWEVTIVAKVTVLAASASEAAGLAEHKSARVEEVRVNRA